MRSQRRAGDRYIGATDRIARTHQLPKDADSALERALARDVRLGTVWTLLRESEAIAVGERSFSHDFTLRHATDFSVLVDVVGFYTPEYLRSKLAALRASASRPLVVCLDDSLACSDGDVSGTVLRFKRWMLAGAMQFIKDKQAEKDVEKLAKLRTKRERRLLESQGSRLDHWDPVRMEVSVSRAEGESVLERLGDEQAIERVTMVKGQSSRAQGRT